MYDRAKSESKATYDTLWTQQTESLTSAAGNTYSKKIEAANSGRFTTMMGALG